MSLSAPTQFPYWIIWLFKHKMCVHVESSLEVWDWPHLTSQNILTVNTNIYWVFKILEITRPRLNMIVSQVEAIYWDWLVIVLISNILWISSARGLIICFTIAGRERSIKILKCVKVHTPHCTMWIKTEAYFYISQPVLIGNSPNGRKSQPGSCFELPIHFLVSLNLQTVFVVIAKIISSKLEKKSRWWLLAIYSIILSG